MPTLTGKIADVTGRPPESISNITVKAPSARIGGGSDIIVTSNAQVDFNEGTGDLTLIGLHAGLSWLYIEGDGWSDSIPLAVAAGFRLILEAVANASGVPGIADYVSMIRSSGEHARELARAAVDGEFGEVVRLAQAAATTAAQEATTAAQEAGNAVSRVEALESMAGLVPESPVDGQTANLISQPDTLTSQAMSQKTDALLASAPMLVTFGKNTGTVRPATDRPVMWVGYGAPVHRQAGDIVVQALMEWPASLDLIAWYDATTAGPAGDVTTIIDRGPNGLDLNTKYGSTTVESGGTEPPVFAFDSSMISTSGLGFDPMLWAYPLTVYLVASVDDTGSTEALFDTTHVEHKATIARTSNGGLLVHTTDSKASPSGVFSADTPVIISVSISDEGVVGEVNGVPELDVTSISAGTGPVTRLRLGANYGGSFPLNGSLGEVIIAHDPTPSEHTSTLEYLSKKWGIDL